MYTVGENQIPFTGKGSTVLATEVTLKINKFKLHLYAIEDKLNFQFQCKLVEGITGNSQLSHSGEISILLGGDIFHAFPKEKDSNS